MKDDQMLAASQESGLQQPKAKPKQSSSARAPQGSSLTLIADVPGWEKSTRSAQSGPWGKACPPQTTQGTEPPISTHVDKCNEDTPGTSQALCVSKPSASFSKQESVIEGGRMTKEGDCNQSEKPKRPKNRRQRRKAGGQQQVVGLPCSPSASRPVLLWFRRDLRLCDNPALIGSLEVGAPVIPVFIWSPEEEEGPGVTVAVGGACELTSFKSEALCGDFPLHIVCLV